MKNQIARTAVFSVASFYDIYKFFTFADKLLIVALIALSIFSISLGNLFITQNSIIEIESKGKLVGKFPLSVDKKIEINGKIGTTIIQIQNNDARIIDAPCPHKLCMQKRLGDIIVCIPNEVVIEFKNPTETENFDAITN